MSPNLTVIRFRMCFAFMKSHIARLLCQGLMLGTLVLFTGSAATAQSGRSTMERTLQPAAPGRWWRNPRLAQTLGLTPDQQKRMDEVFEQSRLKLIDLTAFLDKEEALLEPLVEMGQPDEAKIRSQIDRIAQARSELEKANANMLLGIRLVLTQGQWASLQNSGPKPRTKADEGRDGGDRRPPAAQQGPTPKKSR
jgi:Spy/CpxP family protein refolding chaperone